MGEPHALLMPRRHYKVTLQALQIDRKILPPEERKELEYNLLVGWDPEKISPEEIGEVAAAQACCEHQKRVLFGVISVLRNPDAK